jgi:hypothetical protein
MGEVASFQTEKFADRGRYMAGTEMNIIKSDRWDAEIWGAAIPSSAKAPPAKLAFLFADKDHWVANSTRDGLISRRGRLYQKGESQCQSPHHSQGPDALPSPPATDDWKPLMEVDRTGLVHAFCISRWPLARRYAVANPPQTKVYPWQRKFGVTLRKRLPPLSTRVGRTMWALLVFAVASSALRSS